MKKEEVSAIRQKLGISQHKFAELLGTTVTSVNRWENGKAKVSRLYVKEINELKVNHGLESSRRKTDENA